MYLIQQILSKLEPSVSYNLHLKGLLFNVIFNSDKMSMLQNVKFYLYLGITYVQHHVQ